MCVLLRVRVSQCERRRRSFSPIPKQLAARSAATANCCYIFVVAVVVGFCKFVIAASR